MKRGNWLGGGPVNERREDATIASDPKRSEVCQVTLHLQTLTSQPDCCMLKGVVTSIAPPILARLGMALVWFLQPGIECIKLPLIQHRYAVPPMVFPSPPSISSGVGVL